MGQERENFSQARLIDNFNRFAKAANDYLGIDINQLNEKGCCFGLAQCQIKAKRNGTLDQFKEFYSFITAHFTEKGVSQLLDRAKPRPEDGNIRYREFGIKTHNGRIEFAELVDFVETISKAQVGYESKVSEGRFASKKGQQDLGRFESISGNWEASYPLFVNRENIADFLKTMRLDEQAQATILSGNHAINFTKNDDGTFEVYDSNNRGESRVLTNLEEVGDAIIHAFSLVGCVSEEGNVAMAVDTVSFRDNDERCVHTLEHYLAENAEAAYPQEIAQNCHTILINNLEDETYLDTAFNLYEVYETAKENGDVTDLNDFIDQLPTELRSVVRENINMVRMTAFSDSVKNSPEFLYDASELTPEQENFMVKFNSYLEQYNNGHLSRLDLAINVTNLMEANQEAIEELPIYPDLAKMKSNFALYLDGTVAPAAVIQSQKGVDLTTRDKVGFSHLDMALETSPNPATMKAVLESAGNPQFEYDPETPDQGCLHYMLIRGNADLADYLSDSINLSEVVTTNKMLKTVIESGNFPVARALIAHRVQQAGPDKQNPAGIPRDAFQYALEFNNPSFAGFLIDNGGSMYRNHADALIEATDATKIYEHYESVRRNIVHDEETGDYEPYPREQFDQFLEGKSLSGATGKEDAETFPPERFAAENSQEIAALRAWRNVLHQALNGDNQRVDDALFAVAINKGRFDLAEPILQKATSDDLRQDRQKLLFLKAAEVGNLELIQRLVKQNPDLVNCKDGAKCSALSYACEGAHLQVAEYLIDQGADVQNDTSAPLLYAAKGGSWDVCELMLMHGADPTTRSDVKDKDNIMHGQSALSGVMLSAIKPEEKRELMKKIFKGRVKTVDPIMKHDAAISAAKSKTTTEADMQVLMSETGLDLTTVPATQEGRNLAMLSVAAGNLAMTPYFIKEAELDLHDRDATGKSLLDITLDQLIEMRRAHGKDDVNFDQTKFDAHVDMALQLIHASPNLMNIDPNHPPRDGQSPLARALMTHSNEIIGELLNAGAKLAARGAPEQTPLHWAVLTRNTDLVDLLLLKDVPKDTPDSQGRLAMHLLAGETTSVEQFQKLQVMPLSIQDNKGNSALHYTATKFKNPELIRYLLDQGVDPLQPNEDGVTPLMKAIEVCDTAPEHYSVVLAMLEAVSYRDLAQHRPTLDLLKQHREPIFDSLKAELGQSIFKGDPETGKDNANQRLNQILGKRNGVARLFKVRVHTGNGKLFNVDSEHMDKLKDFQRVYIQGKEAKIDAPQGARYR